MSLLTSVNGNGALQSTEDKALPPAGARGRRRAGALAPGGCIGAPAHVYILAAQSLPHSHTNRHKGTQTRQAGAAVRQQMFFC